MHGGRGSSGDFLALRNSFFGAEILCKPLWFKTWMNIHAVLSSFLLLGG